MNKKFITLSEIETVELDLSTICDGKCPLCFRNMLSFPDKYKKQFFRNYDDIILQLNIFNNLKTLQICGQMSEPTLHPDLLKLVEYAKNRKLNVILYTNGNSQDNVFYHNLVKMLDKNDKIIFTVCGMDNSTHSHYRININLQNVLEHAKVVRNILPIDNAKCISFSYNYEQIHSKEFLDFIKQFSNFEIIDTSYDDHTLFNKNYNIDDFMPNRTILKTYEKIDLLTRIRTQISCDSLNTKSIQIDPYGKIYPCYLFLENNFNEDFNLHYDEILNRKYDSCKFCSQLCLKHMNYCDIK